MYDLNKRSYFTTLGELRMLLADLPDDTEVSGAGAFGAWLHFDKEKALICIDPESLYADYAEEYGDEEEVKEEEQMKEHELRLSAVNEERQFFLVGDKLMRTYETIDDTIDEEDGECFGACWDYELYDVQLRVVDSGQLGKCGNMSREEVIQRVLEWNKLSNEKRTYIPYTDAIVELSEKA